MMANFVGVLLLIQLRKEVPRNLFLFFCNSGQKNDIKVMYIAKGLCVIF